MAERTSEGHEDTGLEPDPVGKPNPEDIDPQLTAMLIDKLRDGLGFPANIKSISDVISWAHWEINGDE